MISRSHPQKKLIPTADFWLALKHIAPSILTFILSFTIILITWVNHHNSLKLVNKSSTTFIYANGFLLLSVVFLPFPTSLVGEYILTDHAAPAIILYNAVIVIQSFGWVLLCDTALKNHLTRNEKSTMQMEVNRKSGYYSAAVYSAPCNYIILASAYHCNYYCPPLDLLVDIRYSDQE